jgi:hypothetical protein
VHLRNDDALPTDTKARIAGGVLLHRLVRILTCRLICPMRQVARGYLLRGHQGQLCTVATPAKRQPFGEGSCRCRTKQCDFCPQRTRTHLSRVSKASPVNVHCSLPAALATNASNAILTMCEADPEMQRERIAIQTHNIGPIGAAGIVWCTAGNVNDAAREIYRDGMVAHSHKQHDNLMSKAVPANRGVVCTSHLLAPIV